MLKMGSDNPFDALLSSISETDSNNSFDTAEEASYKAIRVMRSESEWNVVKQEIRNRSDRVLSCDRFSSMLVSERA